jgi:hypothetical protein
MFEAKRKRPAKLEHVIQNFVKNKSKIIVGNLCIQKFLENRLSLNPQRGRGISADIIVSGKPEKGTRKKEKNTV